MEVIKVSRTTNVSALYGCILSILEQKKCVEVHAVGAAALNQMFKAVALVCKKQGNNLRCTPKLSRNEIGTTFCVMVLE
jgi:stage V sporulation protein SpoVS